MPRLRTVSTNEPGVETRQARPRPPILRRRRHHSPRARGRRPGQGPGHPTGVERRLDRAVPPRAPARGRHRRRGSTAVPVPPGLAGEARLGKFDRVLEMARAARSPQTAPIEHLTDGGISAPGNSRPGPGRRLGCFRPGTTATPSRRPPWADHPGARHVRNTDAGCAYKFVGKSGIDHGSPSSTGGLPGRRPDHPSTGPHPPLPGVKAGGGASRRSLRTSTTTSAGCSGSRSPRRTSAPGTRPCTAP